MTKSILITGGAGYIGSHAVKLFLEEGFHVVVFDNLSRGYKEPLDILQAKGRLDFIKGDLRNKNEIDQVFLEFQIDAVLHFAALCLVNESMEAPDLYFSNNTLGSFNLFESMKQHNVGIIIFSSTCAVYGESEYLPIDEKHATNPVNPYGESKLFAERMLRWYGLVYNFGYIILRYFNVCGASQDGIIGDSKRPSQLLMQNAVRGAMNIEQFAYTCPEVNTPDGTPVRDYIDVEDLVNAHYLAYDYLHNKREGIILNLGNGKGFSVKEIVSKTEHVFGKRIPITTAAPRKGEYAAVYADTTKAKTVLNWQPKKTLEESIVSLKSWYSKYPQGYRY